MSQSSKNKRIVSIFITFLYILFILLSNMVYAVSPDKGGQGTSGIIDTQAPTDPQNLRAVTAGKNKDKVFIHGKKSEIVSLEWSASSDNVGVAGYSIYRDGAKIGTSTDTSFTDDTVTKLTQYEYKVEAFDAAGNVSGFSNIIYSSAGNYADATVPTAPSNLAVTNLSSTSVSLTWNVSTDDTEIAGYIVFRDNVEITKTPTNFFEDKGLVEGTIYNYQIKAYDNFNNISEPSETLTVTTPVSTDTIAPAQPQGLEIAESSPGKVVLSWQPSDDNVGVKGYAIYRNDSLLGTVTQTSFIDNTVSEAVNYSYKVAAYDEVNNYSSQSEPVTVLLDFTAPSVPQNLSASNMTQNEIGLTWTGSTDNYVLKGYIIYKNGDEIARTVGTTYTDTNLFPQTSYIYYVIAYDLNNNISEASQSITVSTKEVADTEPPTMPVGLMVVDSSKSGVVLSWDASTDNKGVTGYTIYRNDVAIGTSTTTTYTDSNISEGVDYTYCVEAYDSGGNVSSKSNSVKIFLDFTAPTIPLNLTSKNVAYSEVSLAWENSTDNFYVKGYKIYRNGAEIGTALTNSFTDSGLKELTEYVYEISAFDASNNVSEKGQPLMVKTTEIPDTQPPSTVTIVGTVLGDSKVNLSWQAALDNKTVKEYIIFRDNVEIARVSGLNYKDSILTEKTSYSYFVKAADYAGNLSSPSNVVTLTTFSKGEPNEDVQNASTAVVGSNYGYIDFSGDVDWYAVNVAYSTKLTATLDVIPSGVSAGIEIYSGDLSKMYTSVSNTVTIDVLAPGTYYVKISGLNGYSLENQYKFTVSTSGITAGLTYKKVTGGIQLNWSAVNGFNNYKIYRKTSGAVDYEFVTQLSQTTFTDTNVVDGAKYSYRVVYIDGTGNEILSESIDINYIAATYVSGVISQDTFWTLEGSPYVLTGNVTVAQGVTLKIMPGVVVKSQSSFFGLLVNGKVDALGTESQSIIFTTTKDAEFGGNGVSLNTDYWYGIYISKTGEFTGDHVKIRYGGGNFNSNYGNNLKVEGKLLLTNSVISNSLTDGIWLNQFRDLSFPVVIKNTKVENSNKNGINIVEFGLGQLTIENNSLISNKEFGIKINLTNSFSAFISGITTNNYQNNAVDGIAIEGTIPVSTTLTKNVYILTKDVIIPQGLTVSIKPGTIIKSYRLYYGIWVNGRLDAMGTKELPIVFTSVKDAEFGGGGVKQDALGTDYWHGISISNTGELVGDYIKVRYGGTQNGNYLGKNINAAGNLTLTNSEIADSKTDGIYINIDVNSDKNVTIENTIIKNSTNNGIKFAQFGKGSVVVKNNNIHDNVEYPIYADLSRIGTAIFANISDNSYKNNKYDAIVIEKSPTTNQTFTKNDYILLSRVTVPAGIKMTVKPGAILKMSYYTFGIRVDGTIEALGTKELPIVFTTTKDSEYGGEGVGKQPLFLDYWYGILVSNSGEFIGDNIKIRYGGSSGSADGITYGYGKNLNILGKLSLTNSEIRNSYSEGINFQTSILPTLVFNSFINNRMGGVINSGPLPLLNAENNYWNSIYGPSLYDEINLKWVGDGDGVSRNIDYSPYLAEELKVQQHFGEEDTNIAGNFARSYTDFSNSTPGFEVKISRTYNSKDERSNNTMGRGWNFSFEASAKDYGQYLKVVRLPNGSAQSFTKSADGTFIPNDSHSTLTQQTDESLILTTKDQYTYGFNNLGYLVWMKDRDGNALNINVDVTNGRVLKITDTAGRAYTVGYSSDGLLESVKDPMGRTVKYEYTNKLLTKVTDPMGYSTFYNYDSLGYLSEIRDNYNNLVEGVLYDHSEGENQHKVKQITDASGNTSTYVYDNASATTTITDSNGRQTINWFDKWMYVVKTQDTEGRQATTEYSADSTGVNKFGEEKAVTDRNGNKTQFERDTRGNVTKKINPDGSYKTFGYDDKNNLISEADELGKLTFYIYDDNKNKLIKKIQPLNGFDQYTINYDQSKFAVTEYEYYTDEESILLGYKAKSLLKSVKDPEGNIIGYTYDEYGNIKSITDPELNVTTNEYNILGWKTKTTSPNGFTTQLIYDNNGRLVKTIGNEGETKRTVYDALGKVTQEVSPNLYNQAFDDLANNSYSEDTGYRYEYFANGKVKSITDPENFVTEYTYDLYGNIKSEKKPNGGIYEYEYDAMNRQTKVFFRNDVSSVPELLEEYSYIIQPDGKTQKIHTKYLNDTEKAVASYTYDYDNREIQRQNADGTKTTTLYNANSTIASETDRRGSTVYYRYDGLNRQTEKWTPFEAVNGIVYYSYESIDYDKSGKKITDKAGIDKVLLYSFPTQLVSKYYEYYKNGTVKSIKDSAGRRTENQYDKEGNLIRQDVYVDAVNKNTTEYVYNHLGKPIEKKAHVKSGDIFGNSFDGSNDFILTTKYSYDKNGNLASETEADGTRVNFEYDRLDRKIKESKSGQDEYGNTVLISGTTTYNWEGKPLTQTDGNGNITEYVYNNRGLLEKLVDAKKRVTAYFYDRAGRKISEVSPKDFDQAKSLDQMNRTTYSYDLMDRVITKSNIYFNAVSNTWTTVISKAYKYDANGNIVKELDAFGYLSGTGISSNEKINSGYGTEYTYNLANKVSGLVDPVSKDRGVMFAAEYKYDGLGRKTSEKNAKGTLTLYYYDNAGNIIKTAVKKSIYEVEQIIKTAQYDLMGNTTSQTDGNGNTILFEYNALGKLRSTVYPGDKTIPSNKIINQYDTLGNLKLQQSSLGKVDTFIYDSFGRLLTHTESNQDGSDAVTTQTKYDKNGNKRFEIDGNGNIKENKFDELNKLISTTIFVSNETGDKTAKTTTFSYDSNGNLLSQTDWRGNTNTNIYDELDRLIEKKDAEGKTIQRLEYNLNGVQSKSFDALASVTEYLYDKNNRLTKTVDPENYPSSQDYDDLGNIKSKTDGNGNITSFEYDEFNRLKLLKNAKDEMSSYTYDLNGNMLTQTDAGNITSTYAYNVQNKLIKRADHGGKTASGEYDNSKTESYTYY